MENPDPKKYKVRMRKGKPVLVDKAVIRWGKRRKKKQEKENKQKQEEFEETAPKIWNIFN